MIKNYHQSVRINHNSNWSYIPDHPYKIIIGGSGSSKVNVLLNSIKRQQPDIYKIYSYVKDPFKSKYQLLINRREKVKVKKLKIQKHSLIILKQLMMFMKIWKTMIQQKKESVSSVWWYENRHGI